MKRIISLALSLVMIISCLSINLSVYATSIDDSSVFIKQTESDWCTYASATNMIRRRALLDGNGNWSSYTDSNLRSAARASGGGMSNSFSYAGYGVTAENWKSKSTEQKKSSLISLLSSHPEGVVIYTFDGTYTHAILACNYTNGTFYVNDPAKKKPSGIIQLTEAQFNGSSQDDRIGWIKKVWYISSGAGTGGTYTPTPTPTPSTPAGIALSSSTINLDYPNSTSQTITVTATGDLPSKYKFEISINSGLNHNWASSWSGSSINLTVSANQNSPSTSTATIYLKDSSNNSVCASINFNINVSKPVVKETIQVSFNSNGGSASFASQTVEKYGTVTIPSLIPSRSGYEFLGWDTNPNSKTAKYRSGETISIGNTNIVIYAIWQKETDWAEWDLNVSKDELYFDNNDNEKTVLVRVDKQDDSEYYFTLEYDEHLDVIFGDEWYDKYGYKCKEVIVSAPEQQVKNNKVTIRMRDENHNIVDSTGFYVYLEDNQEAQFADRNPSGISVYLNGEKLSFDVQPQIINSRTMVPMRKIFESLGTVVGWNNNTQTAISVRKGDVVSVGIGGHYLTVNGEQKLLDSPPVVISGRTLVPVRAIAESFNCDVEWYDYGTSQVVDINRKDTINNMENKGGLVIGYSECPPFSYYDEYGNLIGFDTELAKYVCDFWGWDCSFVEIPFDMGFTAIKEGQIDCYWNAITKTEERMEYATFTDDYIQYLYEYEEDGEWYTSHEVYSVPFRKGDYDTVQLVNIALEEAQKDGTIAYLKSKYGIE